MAAASGGSAPLVQRVLKLSREVDAEDADGETALFYAARRGKADAVEVLVAAHPRVDHVSRGGFTPLMRAAQASASGAVRALLEAGALPDLRNAQDKNWTALMYAVKASSSSAVADLAGGGAFVNGEDRAGDTPMHIAARVSNASVVRALLEHGSDVNRHSGIDRKTPLEIAVEANDRDVAAALVEGGACVTRAMRERAEAKKDEKMIAILADGDRRDCRRP